MEAKGDKTPASSERAIPAFDVVLVVSSAGGLDAISRVLRDLPLDLGVPIVVMQHLAGHGSALVEILRRRLKLPVMWIADGDRLAPGCVHVCPPAHALEILPDHTFAIRQDRTLARDLVFDALLASAAGTLGTRALAVVLTGMGRDGASGALALKRAGGTVIAQSEDTAEHPSMPHAVIASGAADLVVPLDEIATVVADVVGGAPLPTSDAELEALAATFGEYGVIAALAREIDWPSTPLGAIRTWSDAQRSAVRFAMDSSNGVALYFGDRHIQLFNDATIPSLGGRHTEVFARPYAESYPQLAGYTLPVLARVLRGERVHHGSTRVPFARNGRIEDAWFDMSYTPVRDGDGSVIGVYQAFYERTEQVLSARRLTMLNRLARTSNARSRYEAIQAALAVFDEFGGGDVPFAAAYVINAAASRADLVGAVGTPAGGGMAPRALRLAPGSAWPIRQVVTTLQPLVLDDVSIRFRGHLVGREQLAIESAELFPLRDEVNGKAVGVLILGTNPRLTLDAGYHDFLTVTGETVNGKLAESHARQRGRERIERLAELDRVKTEFFSNVSHEFRTPLTLMLGPLEELQRRRMELPSHLNDDVEVATISARRLLTLVDTLLDFSQLEAGRLRPRFEPTDLSALTADIAGVFRSAAERARLQLLVECPPLKSPVWIDRGMWEKIVSNLLSNALKFTLEGSITVRITALAGHAELTVADTGVGIPASEQPHIFKRFHRVRSSPARTREGAGIGLALVDELVRLHHGRVRVRSGERGGTVFTVWIPFVTRTAPPSPPGSAPEDVAAPRIAAALAEDAARWDVRLPMPDGVVELSDAHVARQPHAAAGARILVVDDNIEMRDYLRRLLEVSWHVEIAADGEQAFARMRERPPDLVLADVMMPNVDGFALLKRIREDEHLKLTPVVLLTARAGEEAAIEGLLAGADDYIAKPFSARELVARIGGQIELSRLRRTSEERLATVFDAMPVGVGVFDADGALVISNQQMRDYLPSDALPSRDPERRSPWRALAADGRPLRPSEFPAARALRGERVVPGIEILYRTDEGREIWTSVAAAPIRDADGQVSGAVAVVNDIDELKRSANAPETTRGSR